MMSSLTTENTSEMPIKQTIVCNIKCNKCKNVLPPHTEEQHEAMSVWNGRLQKLMEKERASNL